METTEKTPEPAGEYIDRIINNQTIEIWVQWEEGGSITRIGAWEKTENQPKSPPDPVAPTIQDPTDESLILEQDLANPVDEEENVNEAVYELEEGMVEYELVPYAPGPEVCRYHYPDYNFGVWGKKEGIIENQPFKIRVYARHFIAHSMEGDEGDCEIEIDILEKKPVDPEVARKFWEEWDKDIENWKIQTAREVEEDAQQVPLHPEALAATINNFWSNGNYSEMSGPDSLRVIVTSELELRSDDGRLKARSNRILGSKEGDLGTGQKLLAELLQEIGQKHPGLAGVDPKKIKVGIW